jgi:hypothetical protein
MSILSYIGTDALIAYVITFLFYFVYDKWQNRIPFYWSAKLEASLVVVSIYEHYYLCQSDHILVQMP